MADALAIIGVVLPLAGLAAKGIRELCEMYAAKKEISETIQNVSKQLPLLIDTLTEIEKRLQVRLLKPTAQRIFASEHQNNLVGLLEGCRMNITKLNSLIEKVKPAPTGSRVQVSKKAIAWRLKYGNEFKDIMSRIHGLSSTLSGYLTVRNGIIADETLSLALKGREQRYTDWLQPCDVDFIGKKLDGTCDWIWNETHFTTWTTPLAPPDSDRLLCIYGVHGSGKSVLASSIASGLKDKQQQTLFFSFSGLENNRKSVEHLLRTMLWQLLQIAPPEGGHETMQELMGAGAITTAGLLQALTKIGISIAARVYCIIDGVDESDADWNDPSEGGLKVVLDLRKALPGLQFLLIGRPAALWEALRHTNLKIEMTPQAVKGDIAKFIQVEMEKLDVVSTDTLRTHVYKTLEEKSDGMFLWVKMMLSELRKAANADEVEKMLSDLPRGLHKAYHFVFARLLKRLGKLELHRAQRLLQIVVTACRPMMVNELCYTYAIISEPGSQFEKHLMRQPDQGILNVCGDFITISGGLVRLGHTSVKEFLTRPEEQFELEDSEVLCFNINITKTNHLMGLTCLEYLATCEYGFPLRDPDALPTLNTRYPLLHYASRYGVVHLVRSGPASPDLIDRIDQFLTSRESATWAEYLILLLVHDVSDAVLVQELDLLQEWYDQAVGESHHLNHKFQQRLREELDYRREFFGDEDYRTETCKSAVSWLTNDECPPDDSKSLVVPPKAQTPSDEVSQIMRILNSGSMFSVQKQARVILSLGSIWKGAKGLTDALDALFNMIVSMADRLPVYALSGLGNYYERLGKLDQALKVYKAALSKVKEKENLMECVTLGQIGYILSEMYNYGESEKAFRQEVLKRQRIFGETHSTTLSANIRVARTLLNQNRLDEAEIIVLLVKEKSERVLGENNTVTLDNLKLLGEIQFKNDDFEEAVETFRKVVKNREALNGNCYYKTIDSLDCLSSSLEYDEEYEEAEDIFREIAKRKEQRYGKESADALKALYDVACFIYDRRRYKEAGILCRAVLDTQEKKLGLENTQTLDTLDLLALSLYSQEDLEQAAEVFQRETTAHEKMLGKTHTKTLQSLQWVFQSRLDMRDYTEAEKIVRDLGVRHDSEYGEENLKTMKIVYHLGIVLEAQGRNSEAEVHFRKAVKHIDAALQVGYHEALSWLAALGRIHATKDGETAEMFERTKQGFLGLGRSYSEKMRDTFYLAAEGLCTCEKPLEPEDKVQPVVSHFERGPQTEPLRLLFCQLALGPALERQGDCVKAESLYQTALNAFKEKKKAGLEEVIQVSVNGKSNSEEGKSLATEGIDNCQRFNRESD